MPFLDRHFKRARKKFMKGQKEHGVFKFDRDLYPDIEEELLDCINYCLMQLERIRRIKMRK